MNGGETKADRANADDPTAWRPPFDALSARNRAAGIALPGSELSRDERYSLAHSVGPWCRSRQIELLQAIVARHLDEA
jgi:hypothetical protein